MNQEEFEKAAGVEVLFPEQFTKESEEKIDVLLQCGHKKRCKVKSLLKKDPPKCTQCTPRKKNKEAEMKLRDGLLSQLEELTKAELLLLMASLSTAALKKFFETDE